MANRLSAKIAATGQTIHNILDIDGNRIAEYDFDATTGASSLIREYIWANGVVVAVVENDQIYYVRADHIRRPVFATNGVGAKVWEASYKPFGGVDVTLGGAIDLRFPALGRRSTKIKLWEGQARCGGDGDHAKADHLI